jgi:hypothetical protein
MTERKYSRRDVLIGLGAGLLAAGGASRLMGSKDRGDDKPETPEPKSEKLEPPKDTEYVPVERNEYFDGNPEFLATITAQRGEYTRAQRKERRRVLANGERIFQDVGLMFYFVREGDTISEIRERLLKYDEFSYLREQNTELTSFNIPAEKLRARMWLPIPVEAKDRHLSEAQFISYAHVGIDQMLEHPEYGAEVKRILDRVPRRELIATMIAVAKQEGGGKPLGQFELHRWEARYQSFSFSYFHVLMTGAGLVARRKLNLTEGQLYHPQNGVKLFLAFMVEKSRPRKHADRLFPVLENQEEFAVFYNGTSWRSINANYLVHFKKYYKEASEHLDESGTKWKKD